MNWRTHTIKFNLSFFFISTMLFKKKKNINKYMHVYISFSDELAAQHQV